MKPQLSKDEIHNEMTIEEKNDILRLWNDVRNQKEKWNEDFQNYRRVRDNFIQGPNIKRGVIYKQSIRLLVLTELLGIRDTWDTLQRDKRQIIADADRYDALHEENLSLHVRDARNNQVGNGKKKRIRSKNTKRRKSKSRKNKSRT
jgi:hypothetical protein